MCCVLTSCRVLQGPAGHRAAPLGVIRLLHGAAAPAAGPGPGPTAPPAGARLRGRPAPGLHSGEQDMLTETRTLTVVTPDRARHSDFI